MSAESQHFARVVLDRFDDLDLTTDAAIAKVHGPSSSTMTNLRKAADSADYTLRPPRGDLLEKIDRAARWVPGSAGRLWRKGAEPRVEIEASLVEAIRTNTQFTERQKRVLLESLGAVITPTTPDATSERMRPETQSG